MLFMQAIDENQIILSKAYTIPQPSIKTNAIQTRTNTAE